MNSNISCSDFALHLLTCWKYCFLIKSYVQRTCHIGKSLSHLTGYRTCRLPILLAIPVHAATKTWTGSVNSEWTTSGNWSAAGAPGSSDTANINSTSGPTVSSLNGQAAPTNVGNTANGSLTISSGTLSDTTGSVGQGTGIPGSATVTGVSSRWTNSGSFMVGNNGTGTLDVQNNGTISDVTAYMGNLTGSMGTVTVTTTVLHGQALETSISDRPAVARSMFKTGVWYRIQRGSSDIFPAQPGQ